ncbi:MAG: anaerobic ribonucleoside-triphosphate reductase activating protein [Campylobacterota bacterium]|nr:anaerobic ribonucleoside-triphosphate reductase activating protein [Campylobacterota bacterium]
MFNTEIVYDLTSFSHLDYPNHLACIIWFTGCNMRCDYCYNADIVFAKSGRYTLEDMLDFLKKRVGLLDGVVLSGGEATTHNLVPFCQEIKKLGFDIKLDTNGTNPTAIKELLDLKLLDFIALDYKAPKEKFTQITHSNLYDKFSDTLDLLIQSDIEFEVRTTLHVDLLHVEDINLIITDLVERGYSKTYYIQEFLDTGNNIANLTKSSSSFHKTQLSDKLKIIWR